MIVDTSAIVAILKNEPEATRFGRVFENSTGALRMSAANYVEAGIVADGSGDEELSWRLDQVINRIGIDIVPVSAAQATLARNAYRRFGRGSGHSARLNFGDCFAYALAFESGEPLLFKGDDFAATDIEAAA